MEKKDLLEGKKVLIVDDEPDVLETLSDLLSMCSVVEASSFEEAQEKLIDSSLDLAVLDIMGVDGYKLLDICAEKKLTAVMLTAHALSPGDTVKSKKKGAAYYLPKEEMVNITEHLNDVLQAQEEGKSTWWKWFDKFAGFYDRKFGPDWQDENKEFWEKFKNYY